MSELYLHLLVRGTIFDKSTRSQILSLNFSRSEFENGEKDNR